MAVLRLFFPTDRPAPFSFRRGALYSRHRGAKKGPDPKKGPPRHGCRMPQAPTIPGEDPRGIMHIIMALSAPFVTLQIIVSSSFPAVFRPRGRIIRHMLYVLRRSCQGSTRPSGRRLSCPTGHPPRPREERVPLLRGFDHGRDGRPSRHVATAIPLICPADRPLIRGTSFSIE